MAKTNPKSKPAARALSRTLERMASPAYFVNCEYQIQYANQACADWVGIDLEELISTTCVYSSQTNDDPTRNLCQGLCPPPSLFETSNPTTNQHPMPRTEFVSVKTNAGKTSWRSGAMSPLFGEDHKPLGVMVICGAVSAEPPASNPIDCSVTPERLHAALAQIRTETDRRYSLESLVGKSSFSERVRRQVATAIHSQTDLLILGPTGAGKEHLARTIHAARLSQSESDPADPMTVHCSIVDQQLIQQNIKSILDSHSNLRSSSPSAEADWLLLLDVEKMGESAQSELLGFLKIPDFPLRIIATATNCLIELSEQGNFSQELAHYLSTMTIKLSRLAERKTDIPFLAQALLERDNARRDRQLDGFTKNALAHLTEFNWPENIDQLDRVIQAAGANATTNEVGKSDLPDEFNQWLSAMRIGSASETKIDLDAYLELIEKQLVDRALKQAKGNKTKAAKLLGVSRPKLLRRVQHFELEATPDFSEVKAGDELDESAFEELK